MKILFVADGRSPIALPWIHYFIERGHEVHLASSFPCKSIDGFSSQVDIPVALSDLYGHPGSGSAARAKSFRKVVPVSLRTRIRQWIAPFSFNRAASALREVVEKIQPDILHAMRIPYEGMVASIVINRLSVENGRLKKPALLISVWGNDFTLHARSSPSLARYTRLALQAADGLHTDCVRDQRLAIELGFDARKPGIVLPGGGGVQIDTFYPAEVQDQAVGFDQPITVINPRGIRAYVSNETFFHAIPLVIEKSPHVHFICPAMQGEAQAEKWVRELGIDKQVDLLPAQSSLQMAGLFRQAKITVSVTTHDGTPNTLLEAMACGSFPIVGDIEALREWITQGVNGQLVDPDDPQALADAILLAISQPDLRKQAKDRNLQLVRERAEYGKVMHAAEEFYGRMISKK